MPTADALFTVIITTPVFLSHFAAYLITVRGSVNEFIDDFILIMVIQWSLQSNVRTLKNDHKSPLRPFTIQNTKRFAKEMGMQSPFSAHTHMVYSAVCIGNRQ